MKKKTGVCDFISKSNLGLRNTIGKQALICLIVSIFTVNLALASNKKLDTPKPIPEFKLLDQNSNEFTQDQFRGNWSLLFVGFTTCPDICPMTLANLEAVRADLGLRMSPRNIPNIIFLAVDPDRDQQYLGEYLSYFHPEYIGITGSKLQIDKLIDGIGAFYRIKKRFPTDITYDVQHTSTVYVVNPNAEIIATISPPFKSHSTGEFLNILIREANRQGNNS